MLQINISNLTNTNAVFSPVFSNLLEWLHSFSTCSDFVEKVTGPNLDPEAKPVEEQFGLEHLQAKCKMNWVDNLSQHC